MATALKLRTDIKKLKDALKVKKIPANIKSKLESQLKKSQDELAALKKGKKTPPSKSAVKGTQTALSRLKSLIKKPKYGVYADGQTKDLEEDAVQGAFPKGRRVSKGLKSNQFGSAKENKGKVYYEYRSNRLDVKQPKKRQTYPKLEKGGYMADGGSVKKKIADGGMMAKGGMTEHGLRAGDKILSGKVIGSTIRVRNENHDEDARIDLETGKRTTLQYDRKSKKWIEKEKKASGGIMAKGGKLSLSEFAERYDDNEDNNMHSENVVLLAENFGTKQDILDAKTILAKHEAIGSLPYYLMQERDALSKRLYAKYQEAAKKKESDGGMMADGGVVSKEEFLDEIYDMAGSVQVVEQNDGVQLSTDNRVALMPFIQKYSPFGKSGYGSVSRIDEVDMDGEKYYYMTIGYPKFEKGGMMAHGGEIKKGDMVKVDNPYWHAAMGTDKPVVRKVTMVAGEDVFFKDGSTSSMKYITKMEAGGVMAKGGGISKEIKLYYHQTSGGAEYLMSNEDGDFSKSNYIVRIDHVEKLGGEILIKSEKGKSYSVFDKGEMQYVPVKSKKLYYHKTSGGAEYLTSKEHDFASEYVVRIDGAEKYGGELMIKSKMEDGGIMAEA